MNHTENDIKTSTKPTGRKYASVAALLQGEGASKEVQARVAELEKETRITRQLACMRSAAGITQAQMADRIGCTQSCISKWESESDEDLTIKVISDYCRITNQRVGILVGKPMGHVEAVKAYAWGLRDRLKALAAIARGDDQMEKGIQAFFGEAFFNLLDIFENCQRDLPNGGDFEIRLEIQKPPPRHSSTPPEVKPLPIATV